MQPHIHRLQGTAGIWRFPQYLSDNEDFKAELRRAWEDFVEFNGESMRDHQLLWETANAYLRERIITYVAAYKRSIKKKYRECSEKLKNTQKELHRTPTDSQWQKCNAEFDLWDAQQEDLRQSHRDLTYHKFGNKAGSLLARLTKVAPAPIGVQVIRDETGQDTRQPEGIVAAFETF